MNAKPSVASGSTAAPLVDLWVLGGQLPGKVDVLDPRTVPENLAGRVAMEGLIVLDDDPAARVRWLAETRKRYLDETPRRAQFMKDFRCR